MTNWDFAFLVKDALTNCAFAAPTCVWCHAEFEGDFTHDRVRNAQWRFNSAPTIADNFGHPWIEERKDSWVRTCLKLPFRPIRPRLAGHRRPGTSQGLGVEREAKDNNPSLVDRVDADMGEHDPIKHY